MAMTVDEIFTQAKALFHYTPDQVCWGKAEYWASLKELESGLCKTGEIVGDCDDFASWCVGKLRENGLPARYVVCQVETGEYHCVAEHDGLVLDNRQSMVMQYFGLPYKWLSISGFNPGDDWHSVLH